MSVAWSDLTAEQRRLHVLRNYRDVYSGRLYRSSSESRSVEREVTWLVRHGLAEEYGDRGGTRLRLTAGGETVLREGIR